MNVAMLLEMTAEAAGTRVAVGPRASGLTYAELLSRARRAATVLTERGAERAGIVGYNSEAVPILLFGAGIAGIPFVPINYRLPDEQLAANLARLAPATVVIDASVAARVAPLDGVSMIDCDEFESTVADSNIEEHSGAATEPDDIAVLLFTSGTSGEPKIAVLRHRHLTSYVISSVEFLGAAETDAQLVSVPPYHVAGISAVLSSVYSGRRIVYLPTFDAEAWVQTAANEAITQAMVVPTMLGRLLDELERLDVTLPHLRHLSYGGGRMPVPVIERAMKVLDHVNFVNAYGLTETSSTITVLSPEDHRDAFLGDDPATRSRLGSVGRPLPTIELEVRDSNGKQVPVGTRGEIVVRGEQIAGEYLGRSLLTDDGWFPTRDSGYVDTEGYVFVEGRLDDVIVRGAENLSPAEIEDVLITHPSVTEAAVFGVPDHEWGETVAAAVVLGAGKAADAEELRDWVRDRLRSTKTPDRIYFRDELPQSATGKLLRRVLKTEASASAENSPSRRGASLREAEPS